MKIEIITELNRNSLKLHILLGQKKCFIIYYILDYFLPFEKPPIFNFVGRHNNNEEYRFTKVYKV